MKRTLGEGYTIHNREGKTVAKIEKKTYMTDECYDKDIEKDFNKEVAFVKMYSKIAYVLGEKLTATEFKAAYQLAYFVGYETCILTNNKSGRGNEYLTLQDIADILGMDYKTAARVVRSLRNKGVMTLVEVGHCDNKYYAKYYVMNPYIYINGKVPDKDTLKIFFEHSGWQEIMEEASKLSI